MPKFLNKIVSIFKKKSFVAGISTLWSFGDSQKPTGRDLLDAYEACFLVYRCIRVISEQLALSTELRLYKFNRKEIDEVDDHELLDLLAKVNPRMSRFEFLDMTQTFIESLGNAYWLKVRGERTNKIIQLEMLRPDWVTVEDKTEGRVYTYELPGGTKFTYNEQDVIHFTQPNPKSHIYGLSTVKPALELIKTMVYLTRWNMNFFQNNARPDYLIISKSQLDEEEKAEFKKTWAKTFTGTANAHKFGLLSGDIEVKGLNFSQKDMQMTTLTESLTDQILTAFGVPRAVIGMKGMNRAEAEAQIFAFLSETIEPKIKRIVEKLNEFLVPDFGDNLYLDYDDPVPANRDSVLLEYDNGIKNNWLLINEIRDREGLPPVEGGWDFYMPISSIPVGGTDGESDKGVKLGHTVIKGITAEKYFELKEENRKKKLLKKALEGKRMFKAKDRFKQKVKKQIMKQIMTAKSWNIKGKFTTEQKQTLWEEHDKALIRDERIFSKVLRQLFKNQKGRALDAFNSQAGENLDVEVLNWDVEKQLFEQVAEPVITEIVKERGARADRLVGREKRDFIIDATVLEFIQDKIFKFANEVNNTTRERLKTALQEGIREGESIQQLGKRIDDVFKNRLARYEVLRIARTETLSASNGAEEIAYEQNGVQKKEWLATNDDRTRDSHSMISGEVVRIDDDFSNGLRFPGDPSGDSEEVINCRCSLLPVLE